MIRRQNSGMSERTSSPALRGGLLALLAALLFGLSTPLVQHFGRGLGAFATAALLYAGAALVGLALRQPATREARLRRSDMPRLLAMAALGAVIGPVALAWGLQHTSGSSASLMLSLEAAFTVLLAWRLYGETLDRRVALAMALLLAGGLALVLEQGRARAIARAAGGAGRHRRLGHRQHALTRRGRARPVAGGAGQSRHRRCGQFHAGGAGR